MNEIQELVDLNGMINLVGTMQEAEREIQLLRRRCEILDAKVDTFEACMALATALPRCREGQALAPDIAYQLQQEILELEKKIEAEERKTQEKLAAEHQRLQEQVRLEQTTKEQGHQAWMANSATGVAPSGYYHEEKPTPPVPVSQEIKPAGDGD